MVAYRATSFCFLLPLGSRMSCNDVIVLWCSVVVSERFIHAEYARHLQSVLLCAGMAGDGKQRPWVVHPFSGLDTL